MSTTSYTTPLKSTMLTAILQQNNHLACDLATTTIGDIMAMCSKLGSWSSIMYSGCNGHNRALRSIGANCLANS